MKKYLLSIVCLMMIGMQSVKAQLAIAALHHEGHVSIYSSSAIQDAIDGAVKGDTIYLSEGMFGGFNVAKPIAIIGAGQTTIISSDITIGQKDSPTEAGLLICGLRLIKNLKFEYEVDGVRIMQCLINGDCDFGGNSYTSYNFSDVEIMSSQIKGRVRTSSRVQSITIYGSKINTVYHSASALNDGKAIFSNCNIGSSGETGGKISYLNCIVNTLNYGVFSNCLYSSIGNITYKDYLTTNNCYQADFSMDDELNTPYSDDEMQTAGYFGTDGKIVGITGGEIPFTLVSSIVQVTEHNIEVDSSEKKLKVSLKLGNK